MLIKSKKFKKLHGQSVMEYVLIVGIITVVLFAMMQQVKRGTQSLVKVAADEISNQQNADQSFSIHQGYLDSSNAVSSFNSEKRVIDEVGVITYVTNDVHRTMVNTLTNMGFTNEAQ